MKNLTWQNPEQLFVAQELINKVKSKCCGIKVMEKPWNVKFPYKTDYPYFKLMWRLGRKMELVKLYILHRLYRIYQLTLVSKEGRKI